MYSKLFLFIVFKKYSYVYLLHVTSAIIPIFKCLGIKLGFGFNFTLNSDSCLLPPNVFPMFINKSHWHHIQRLNKGDSMKDKESVLAINGKR